MRNSPEGHVDHDDLKAAQARMKEVAITINEKKGEVENFGILVNIYNRLDPKLEVNLMEFVVNSNFSMF